MKPAEEPGSTTHASSLVFEGVSMVFPDGTEALRSIDLVVDSNEFVSIVGPSGCGKSTLLRLASGLLEPTAGHIAVDRDRLGYVFQDATLFPWRTVVKNVELFTQLHGVDKRERRRRAVEALRLVGLEEFQDHYPRALSGGMAMRCSIARSMTLTPTVFLFDEPFGALDEITRQELNARTQEVFKSAGFAGLFITHSISEAVFMSSRVVVMSPRPGQIVTEFEVPFEYPRPGELRFDPEFGRLSGEVSKALRLG